MHAIKLYKVIFIYYISLYKLSSYLIIKFSLNDLLMLIKLNLFFKIYIFYIIMIV